jgi:hypothetical protein
MILLWSDWRPSASNLSTKKKIEQQGIKIKNNEKLEDYFKINSKH